MKKRNVLRSRSLCLRFLPVLVAFLVLSACAPAPVAANEKYAAIVVDANTGETLFARHAESRRYPASLTKMMTLYVLFEELEAGRLNLDSGLSVSANAQRQAPSKLGVKAGSTIKVEQAILALVTKSANDVAVVVAENVGGSVSGFAGRMNRAAKALGMDSTTFRNPHGLPDNGQYTTARDLVRLARALQDRFPSYYKYFGERSFTYKGTRYRNHNRLLGNVTGVDGIKTGYIRASGFNLVTNVRRDGRHVIAVVMGGRTASSRDAHMRELIAQYLPKASRNRSAAPLLVASSGAADAALAAARLPRSRPQEDAVSAPFLRAGGGSARRGRRRAGRGRDAARRHVGRFRRRGRSNRAAHQRGHGSGASRRRRSRRRERIRSPALRSWRGCAPARARSSPERRKWSAVRARRAGTSRSAPCRRKRAPRRSSNAHGSPWARCSPRWCR